ncbi:tat (twin-arginine translocation) pathway signal sequence [Marinobacter changyiensis]|uniref:tat (twin-arginine translocation) pathway signal sequence n=1 Tax=Marinobacter changyiensis TaxID=2604091 RepID=UPI0012651300|nr:tat (twin-arginine translocation) pathway signal sequence [Marinobacter changyiensis]
MSLSRRNFLRNSRNFLVGTLAFSNGAIALLAPSRAWSMPLNHLTSAEGETILKVTRHIFPHDTLEDAVYAFVVKDLDKAASDDAVHNLLTEGVKDLNQRAGGDWSSLSASEQFRYVEEIAGAPFFEAIRSTAVVSLYNNELAFAHFGYEGAAGDGGYLNAGFDDLDWLPAPSPADSGVKPG